MRCCALILLIWTCIVKHLNDKFSKEISLILTNTTMPNKQTKPNKQVALFAFIHFQNARHVTIKKFSEFMH